ncbi:MAG: NHLP leader peptide family RiPP precursor [Chlamydiales bacterium]
MAHKPKNAKELEAKIIAHAWKDPRFKEKLLKNPRAALKEMGLDIPENIQVKAIEDKSNSFTFVLPPSIENAKEMSEQELERLAAGAGFADRQQTVISCLFGDVGSGGCVAR